MAQNPTSPCQCVERYVDFIFYPLSKKDWSAAKNLVDVYIVSQFYPLSQFTFNISELPFSSSMAGINFILTIETRECIIDNEKEILGGKSGADPSRVL